MSQALASHLDALADGVDIRPSPIVEPGDGDEYAAEVVADDLETAICSSAAFVDESIGLLRAERASINARIAALLVDQARLRRAARAIKAPS